MLLKILKTFNILALILTASPLAHGKDIDRGAGGGGDGLIALLNEGLIYNDYKKQRSIYHRSSLKFYEDEFCKAMKKGLQSGISFPAEASTRANEICASPGSKIVAQHGYLVSPENTRLMAKNYPELSKIELSTYRIEELRSELPPDLFQLAMEIVGVHEVLSLLKIESSNDYHLSHKIMYLSNVDFSIETLEKYGFRSMNSLELALGAKALNYDFSKRYNEFYGGLRMYVLRDFLATFSPVFDEEITATIGDDYLLDFQKRKVQRGSRYMVPWNDAMLEPIKERLEKNINRRNRLEVYTKPSWALAMQLHQILLAIQKLENLSDYKIVVSRSYIPLIENKLKINRGEKIIEIKIQDNLSKKLHKLQKNIKFEFIRDYYFEPPPRHITKLIQDWLEIDIGQMDATFAILPMAAGFEIDSRKPDYLDTKKESSSIMGKEQERHSLGLVTYSEILEAIKE
ncbi:MAG: hypothetical protein A4S09_11460 [Proteobacteria bacterium SG_bin7]|nr:MAG: hypothetical protein A4S09_11460 [Proteobacteria bacterium SG_bin7]